jgi:putative flippase GtrA
LNERLGRLWHGLDNDRRAFVAQILRYGIAGVGITLFQMSLYNLLLGMGHQRPQIANIVASGAAMIVGYTIHSRFTFEAKDEAHDFKRTLSRFLAVNLTGVAVNAFWVWLIEKQFGLSAHWASVPFFFATPAMLFWLNRQWVFE